MNMNTYLDYYSLLFNKYDINSAKIITARQFCIPKSTGCKVIFNTINYNMSTIKIQAHF